MANPLLVGGAIDSLRQEVSLRTLLSYAGLIIGLTALQGVFSFLQRIILVSMSRDVELELRNQYFSHLETQPQAFFQNHPTGDLMARATKDLEAVRMLCGPAIMYSFNTLFAATGALFFMTRINGSLTLLSLATMPLVVFATNQFGRRIHHLFSQVQQKFSEISARTQENLAGVRVVRAYAREAREEADFAKK